MVSAWGIAKFSKMGRRVARPMLQGGSTVERTNHGPCHFFERCLFTLRAPRSPFGTWDLAQPCGRSCGSGADRSCDQSMFRLLRPEWSFAALADKGVIAHFFYPGTRIIDTPECPVSVIVDAGADAGMETIRMRHFHPEAPRAGDPADRAITASSKKRCRGQGMGRDIAPWFVVKQMSGCACCRERQTRLFQCAPAKAGEMPDIEATTMNTVLALAWGARSTSSRWTLKGPSMNCSRKMPNG